MLAVGSTASMLVKVLSSVKSVTNLIDEFHHLYNQYSTTDHSNNKKQTQKNRELVYVHLSRI